VLRRLVLGFIVVSAAGCAKTDHTARVQESHDSIALVDTTKIEPSPVVFTTDSESPRIVVDSSAKEPRMELRDGAFIVHLPLDMARVLADSLPDFAPIKRKAFDKGLVSWRDNEAANPNPPVLDPADSDAVWNAALSVAVGDFNGDTKRDVAMEGISGDRFATFFLLSATNPKSPPTLLYFRRPDNNTWSLTDRSFIFYLTLVRPGRVTGFADDDETPVLDLKHDAIDLGAFEKASELYYIENGVVKVFTTSD
jgi:hypothetical protein